jgi:uncharacterized protein
MPTITAIYGALSALIVLALALNVIRCRGKYKVGVGDGGNPQMLLAIRLHANAAEYVPLALVAMLLYELIGGSIVALHVTGVTLLVARIAHPIGLLRSTGSSLPRAVGICGSFIAVLIPVCGILCKVIF